MKSFLAILSEKQTQLLNETLLNNHIQYLQTLRKKGHLPMCGPFADNQGAMMVIRADSKPLADELVKCDPFIQSHYYKKFTLHEFTEAGDENHWLSRSSQTRNNIKN